MLILFLAIWIANWFKLEKGLSRTKASILIILSYFDFSFYY